MGVVKRQGFKRSVVDYAGVAIGMISVFFVYPLVIELYGTISFLRSSALLISSFAALGLPSITIRFFPDFKDDTGKHHGFLPFLLLMVSGSFLVLAVFWYGWKGDLLQFFSMRSETQLRIENCFAFVFPLAFFYVLIKVLVAHSSNFQRIVIPAVVNEFFLKLLVPVLCLLFFFSLVDVGFVLRMYFWSHLAIVIALLVYLRLLGQLQWTWPTAKIWKKFKEIVSYASYNLLGNVGAALTQQMDVFMMGNLTDARNTGSYDLGIRLVSPLSIPQRAVMSITAPLVADGVKREDWNYLYDIYWRSALNLLAFSAGLFLLLFFNLDDLSKLLPGGEVFHELKPVVFLLGLSSLFDMSTSVNGHLISFSRYYRANVLFVVLLGILNTILNILLIPRFGMTGAALATACSLVGYNITKLVFVRVKFGFWPFRIEMLYLLLISITIGGLCWLLPLPFHPLTNMIIRSILVAVLYVGSVWYFKLSQDFQEALVAGWEKVKTFFGRL